MPRIAGFLMLAVFLSALHSRADAQERGIGVGLDVGAATTWDDEGLLGRGPSVAGHLDFALNERVRVRGVFDRVPYYRDTSWLRFDGRMDFIGVEVEHRLRGGTVQPFILGGGGLVNFSDVWVHKRSITPTVPPTEDATSRSGRFSAAVLGAGIDIALSPQVSLRPHIRTYMMSPDSDVHPHLSIRPGVGLTMRW